MMSVALKNADNADVDGNKIGVQAEASDPISKRVLCKLYRSGI